MEFLFGVVLLDEVEFVPGSEDGMVVDGVEVAVLAAFDFKELADLLLGLLDLLLQGRQVQQLLLEIYGLKLLGLFHEKNIMTD